MMRNKDQVLTFPAKCTRSTPLLASRLEKSHNFPRRRRVHLRPRLLHLALLEGGISGY